MNDSEILAELARLREAVEEARQECYDWMEIAIDPSQASASDMARAVFCQDVMLPIITRGLEGEGK